MRAGPAGDPGRADRKVAAASCWSRRSTSTRSGSSWGCSPSRRWSRRSASPCCSARPGSSHSGTRSSSRSAPTATRASPPTAARPPAANAGLGLPPLLAAVLAVAAGRRRRAGVQPDRRAAARHLPRASPRSAWSSSASTCCQRGVGHRRRQRPQRARVRRRLASPSRRCPARRCSCSGSRSGARRSSGTSASRDRGAAYLCYRTWSGAGPAGPARAMRDHEVAAGIMGVHVARYKAYAFLVSSMYAGLGGVLLALAFGRIVPETFGVALSIEYLAMVVIGGLGSAGGRARRRRLRVLPARGPRAVRRPSFPGRRRRRGSEGITPAVAAKFAYGAADRPDHPHRTRRPRGDPAAACAGRVRAFIPEVRTPPPSRPL